MPNNNSVYNLGMLPEITVSPNDKYSDKNLFEAVKWDLTRKGFDEEARTLESYKTMGYYPALQRFNEDIARKLELRRALEHANTVSRKDDYKGVALFLAPVLTLPAFASLPAIAPRVVKPLNFSLLPKYGDVLKSPLRLIGEQMLTSTAGYEGVNLASNALYGKNFEDGIWESIPGTDKVNPFLAGIIKPFFNPGGYLSPSGALQITKTPLHNPKLLYDWLYSIADDISTNTKNFFKRFITGIKNNYQNYTLKKIPVSSEFKTYIDPTLQRLLPSLRSYIEELVPSVYLETDNLLSRKNGLGYWDGKYIKLRKTVPTNYSKASTFGHEARHVIDDEVLNVLTNDQINIINDAYDWNNLDLFPNYKNIDAEKVTTNVDARNLLFDSYRDKNIRNYSVDQQNQTIDSYSDQAIVDFVQKSNIYGRRYINYLKKNNKLIPEKIQQFRDAMKYVPIITPFIIPNNNE